MRSFGGTAACEPGAASRDVAVGDDDGLVFPRARASAVDHPNVLERDHGSLNGDERLRSRV